MEKQWKQWQISFPWAPKSLQMVTAAMKLKMLAPWKKSYDKPRQHTQKAETFSSVQFSLLVVSDSLLPDKGPYSQRSGFSRSHVWMWELDHTEGWAQNNGYFELWYWRRLLRVPWTARRSTESILKEISPEYSLEGLILRLKFQLFGNLMWRTDSLEKVLMLGKIEGRRRRGWQ